MEPWCSAQDVLLCDICKTVPLQSHCKLCHINLCINCVGKHLSDSSKKHNIVSYEHNTSTPNYPECQNHVNKQCELFCEKCNIPVCSTCVSSGKHKGHDLSDILKYISSKTHDLQKDLEELETIVHPKYEEIVSDIQTEKARLETDYGTLTTTVEQHGEVWHGEIDAIVRQRKSDIQVMKNQHMAILNKDMDDITQSITEIKRIILDLKKMLSNNDVSQAFTYKSRNTEFQRLPPKVLATLPSFSPERIETDQLHELFGSLSPLNITKEEHVYTMKTPEAVSALSVAPLLDELRLNAIIDTGYTPLCSVTCLNNEEIWTCGANKTMKLHNLQGRVVKTIQAKSGNIPGDIAVTVKGDLLYTDSETKTVNLVKNKKIQTIIRLEGWEPRHICSTAIGGFLVTMISEDYTQSKVVRYSGITEMQTIQFDDQGRPLYSSDRYTKYISENRNLDICVADNKAKAVVVVNQSGKLRFRYTGHLPDTKEPFKPAGITTDSQSHIITADYGNDRIHILDQDGHFLRYIDKCGLYGPWGLCVDTRDNLFVTDDDNEVKKFQYL